MKKRSLLLPFMCCLALWASLSAAFGQTPPKREFRGVWITTINNIDWPSKSNLGAEAQKREYLKILDELEQANINAVFVQIRPNGDAFFESNDEPWSEWLAGAQGQAASPNYDPMAFMIEETHKRNMEFHAWLNPYRVVANKAKISQLAPNHVALKHPEWLLEFGEAILLDPGNPEVRDYLVNLIRFLVSKYDIDGIHFDDYFYPYPKKGYVINDLKSFVNYPDGYTDKADWRRHNVDLLIRNTYANIKSINPRVKFGVSPFGVWRNKASDPLGSDSRAGIPSYDSVYADTRQWLKDGVVDYMMPQLYWAIGFPAADYQVLTYWWAANAFSRHIYIGHAAYKAQNATDPAWVNPSQIPSQIRMARDYPEQVKGSGFFSAGKLLANPNGLLDSLKTYLYSTPALPPAMAWKDNVPPRAPRKFKVTPLGRQSKLKWKQPRKSRDKEKAFYYLIYRFEKGEKINLEDATKIVGKISAKGSSIYYDYQIPKGGSFVYAITALDRTHNEGPPVFAEVSVF